MKLAILAALLAVAATSVASGHHRRRSECCSAWKRYIVPISSSVAPTKPTTKPWQYAVRVGQSLFMTSVRAFTSFANRTIISPGGTYNEAIQVMSLTEQILNEAGCTWNDVHDVVALITAGPTDYPVIDTAMNDFCATHGCSGFPWTGHLRTSPSFSGGATVEFTVQASNCNWTGEDNECSCE
ncbi:uncharacterized protein LOC129596966 [Paramacrobiotus metropolitanus]|uniref:uncharacterized protein LOC129596966 n=1 Tax=Paramacrobiotus metropolitanus TaxID=2943436 RepID=UPI0024461771|nr:uncharacterized protein LOC129596966 [Paramacrobiotus metropolitanus]